MPKARQQPVNQTEQLVQFRYSDAQRIANVVNWYEGHRKERLPSRLPRASGAGASEVFKVCTFSGAWAVGQSKTVTFLGVTATPNTVTATNLFANVPAPSGSGHCAVARYGAAWYLIAATCSP